MQNVKLKVISLNISDHRGTIKIPVDCVEMDEYGISNDAHSGDWNRQISILGRESFERFSQMTGRSVKFGEFAENIRIEGFDLRKVSVSDRLKAGAIQGENLVLLHTRFKKIMCVEIPLSNH